MFQSIAKNPLLKTLFTNALGALAVGADAAIQGGPTGGFAAYLNTHAQIVPIYLFVQQFAHNYLSNLAKK